MSTLEPIAAALISRRSFLVGSGLAAGAAVFAGCGVTPPSPNAVGPATPTLSPGPSPSIDLSDPPFGLWRTMRDAVRRSPDHLEAAAAAAVASRDPDAIFAFVRDQIAVLPPDPTNFYAATATAVRWGVRGTLRGGAGTPRERADLLAELYGRAGLDARVVSGSSNLSADDVRKALLRPVERVFDPGVDAATIDAWRSASGLAPSAPADAVDPDGTVTKALADRLAPLLQGPSTTTPPDLHPIDMPYVEVTVAGVATPADAFLPDARLGDRHVTGDPSDAGPSGATLPVHLELAVASALRPAERNVVLSADWTADQVVGRQVALTFVPPGPLGAGLTVAPRDIVMVTPVAVVQAVDLEAGFDPSLAVVGTAFTVGGEPVAAADDGSLAVGDRAGAISTGDPTAAAQVATLDVQVDAGRFPIVEVALTPRTASGAVVAGLGADQIALGEDGRDRGFLLTRDHVPAPRVLLLFDTSASMPDGFAGDPLVALGNELADRIRSAVSGVELAATTLLGSPAWTSDAGTLDQQLRSLGLAGSDALWHGVAAAAALEPDVIVLVTDGQSTDGPTPMLEAAVAGGPPVVGIAVGGPDGLASLQALAAASSGGSAHGLGGGAAATAADAVSDLAVHGIATAVTGLPPYRLRYRAVSEGPASRTVTVSLPGGVAPAASARYSVPPAEDRATPRALGRLELTIKVGDESITRVLAGSHATDPGAVVTPGQIDDAWATLFGTVLIAFEGGDVPAARLIDDVLTAAIARRPLAAAIAAGDAGAIDDALGHGYPELPPALVDLLAPVGGADGSSATFGLGLRVVMLRTGPRAAGGAREHVDLLPLSRWTTLGPDPAEAFNLTLRRSAVLAVVEGAAFARSTASELDGAPLRRVDPNIPLSSGAGLSDAVAGALDAIDDPAYRGDIRLARTDGRPAGYWAVDPTTGTLWGVLPDGSGGGETAVDSSGADASGGQGGETQSTGETLEKMDKVGAAIGAGGDLVLIGPVGLAFGAVLVIGIAAARQYVRAASYLSVDPSDNPTTNAQEVANLACNLGRVGDKYVLGEGAAALEENNEAALASRIENANRAESFADIVPATPFHCG